jgi:antitoxin HicB
MNDKEIKEQAKYYANLPYTITIEKCNDQGIYYIAKYLELPHFIMTGDTPEEAVKELESEKLEWFEFNLKKNNDIPLPFKSREYSGKIILRMPPKLHKRITEMAELQGISINNFMIKAVAQASNYNDELSPIK